MPAPVFFGDSRVASDIREVCRTAKSCTDMSQMIYSLLQVRGGDAAEFLQGQLTQDIDRVTPQSALPAAWCNPKGRVIALLRILEIEGGYGLVLPATLAEPVCKRLANYRLRADVSLDVAGPDWTHSVFHSDSDMEQLEELDLKPERAQNACRNAHGLIAVNIGIDEPCVEVFGQEPDFVKAGVDSKKHADFEFLSGAKIRAGIAEILENTSEKYTPHMLNLDLLGAVSFDKGCYTGQEVVARTENFGKSKRRVMRYRSDDALTVGHKLSVGDTNAGEVINVSDRDLLAVTSVTLHGRKLSAVDIQVTPAAMPYSTTD